MIIKKTNKGFTVIELLITIAIVAILSRTILSSVSEARTSAEYAKFYTQVEQLFKANEAFRLDKGYYPQDRMSECGDLYSYLDGSNGAQTYLNFSLDENGCGMAATTDQNNLDQNHFLRVLKDNGYYNQILTVPKDALFVYANYKNGNPYLEGCGDQIAQRNRVVLVAWVPATHTKYLPESRKRLLYDVNGIPTEVEDSFCFYID